MLIHHTFGPHVNWRYARQGLCIWNWLLRNRTNEARNKLAVLLQCKVALFATGRQALLAYLQAIDLQTSEEVIIQGYTCAVVPNAVHAAGGTAVYADIDRDTLNLSIDSVRKCITPRTRAIICQHTFGIAADLRALRQLCDEHDLLLIEDCAHVMPSEASAPVGTAGDALLLSFGRDKAVSSVTGGAIAVRNEAVASQLKIAENSAKQLPLATRLQYWLYPQVYWKAKYIFWPLGLGKLFLKITQVTKLLPRVVSVSEKQGYMPLWLNQLPRFCAHMLCLQLEQLEHTASQRTKLTKQAHAAAQEQNWTVPQHINSTQPLLKYPTFWPEASKLIQSAKAKDIYLYDGWRSAVVNPSSVNQDKAGYKSGSCPIAEAVARDIVCLPTHPTMTSAAMDWLLQQLEELPSSGKVAP